MGSLVRTSSSAPNSFLWKGLWPHRPHRETCSRADGAGRRAYCECASPGGGRLAWPSLFSPELQGLSAELEKLRIQLIQRVFHLRNLPLETRDMWPSLLSLSFRLH